MYIFKQGIWANQIHLQSFETLIFNDTATIRLQVYTFGVESFTDGWIRERRMAENQFAPPPHPQGILQTYPIL